MLAGTPSVFIRLAGCPLRCRWCDTAYAWDYSGGDEYSPAEIAAAVQRWPCRHVVITGGEPLVGPDLEARPGLAELTSRLRALGRHITIETAGVWAIPDLACDLMSISLKLGNATPAAEHAAEHERLRCNLTAAKYLMGAYPYQLKFVIGSASDGSEVHAILEQLGPVYTGWVWLMPQARSREEMLEQGVMVAEMCLQSGFCFSPRLQAMLWDNRRGK